MSLVFASIVPHSPVLIPNVGKNHASRLQKTKKAYDKLSAQFALSRADTAIIISPHGFVQENAFTLDLNPEYTADFEEFGDFSFKLKFTGNIGLAHGIREKLEVKSNLQMTSCPKLDYGASIPLYLLLAGRPKTKILPFYCSGLDLRAHFDFGRRLGQEVLSAKENIAIIASGDLSHCLDKNSPAGFSPKAKKFDNKIISALLESKTDELLEIDESTLAEIGECGLKPILILLGVLDGVRCEPKLLSYESPFGVGYMAMNFQF